MAGSAFGTVRGYMAQGDSPQVTATNQRSRVLNIPGKAQLLGEYIRGPGGQESQRHRASGKPVYDLVEGAIAAADDYQLPLLANRSPSHLRRRSRTIGGRQFRFNAVVLEHLAYSIERPGSKSTSATGHRIEDQQRITNLNGHQSSKVTAKPVVAEQPEAEREKCL
jgi:hypothetical protein